MLKGNNDVVKVTGITCAQEKAIKQFLQGAVYAWCNVNKNKSFHFRDLLGGDNFFWPGTPLSCLFDKYMSNDKDEEAALEKASKDAVMLLKSLLIIDQYKTFDQEKVAGNGFENIWFWLA